MFFSNIHTRCVRQLPLPFSAKEPDDGYRLLYFAHGAGSLEIDGRPCPCGEYGLFFVRPGERFSAAPEEGLSADAIEVCFEINDAALSGLFSSQEPEIRTDPISVRSCILNILSFYSLQPPLFEDSVDYNVISLLYFGYVAAKRKNAPHAPFSDESIFSASPNEKLNQALSYVEDHIQEEFSAAEICDVTGQSQKQLSDMFRYEYGCTLLQFVNRFRLFKAKELMCYTNYSITEISQLTGFKSIHYFSRYFKEKESMSPIEYKRAAMRRFGSDAPGQ